LEGPATLFRVQVWAGDGVEVEPWREDAIEDLRFYRLSKGNQSSGALVLAGRPVPLKGTLAFRSMLERVDLDLVDDGLIAGISMLLLEPGNRVAGGVPWSEVEVGDDRVPDQQALARKPERKGQELVYWHWHETGAELVRCRVMLDSLYVACEAGSQLVAEQADKEDLVTSARRLLGTDNEDARVAGVHMLTRADSAFAGGLLLEVVQLDASPRVRTAAVAALGHLGPRGTGEVLAKLLLNDVAPDVRRESARILPAFRPEGLELQLQIASMGDPDASVRQMARISLGLLQR
jgi:hypothetical protein